MCRYDIIVAFSWEGIGEIARVSEDLFKKLGIPVVAQRHDREIFNTDNNIYFVGQRDSSTTLSHVEEFAQLAKQHQWKTCVVVAHPAHLRRCLRDLRKYGFSTVSYKEEFTDTIEWPKPRIKWKIREFILRALPWWLYKKVARL